MSEASDNELLGRILRRYLTDGQYRYWTCYENGITLDAGVDITDEEQAAVMRVTGGAQSDSSVLRRREGDPK